MATVQYNAYIAAQAQSSLIEERVDKPCFLPQAMDCKVELFVKLFQVFAHEIAHLDVLQVIPASLVPRVQVRGVTRQHLQSDRSTRVGYKLLHQDSPVNWRAVPHDQQPLVCHLRETRRLTADTFEQRRDQYMEKRVMDQIGYYKAKLASAKKWRMVLNAAFVVGSISAMVGTFAKLLIHLHDFSAPEAMEHRLSALLGSMAIVLPVLAVAALSLAVSRDLEARVHTYEEMRNFLDGHLQSLRQTKTDHAFAALALEAEARLLGETATWYSRRAFTGIS